MLRMYPYAQTYHAQIARYRLTSRLPLLQLGDAQGARHKPRTQRPQLGQRVPGLCSGVAIT